MTIDIIVMQLTSCPDTIPIHLLPHHSSTKKLHATEELWQYMKSWWNKTMVQSVSKHYKKKGACMWW